MIEREWEKSFASEPNGGSCVEVDMSQPGEVAVRDDKLGETSPILTFDHDEWSAFLIAVKAGQFDLPGGGINLDQLVTALRQLTPEQQEQLWYRLEDAVTLADPALQEGLRAMHAGKTTKA